MSDGLQERRKAETKRALSCAALRLARELGPDGVTVEAIAEAAGVSPRTFFNYFASKDNAIVGVTPTEASELVGDLVDRTDDEPPLVALRAMCAAAAVRLESRHRHHPRRGWTPALRAVARLLHRLADRLEATVNA